LWGIKLGLSVYSGIYAQTPKFSASNIDELKQILESADHVNRVNQIREKYANGENVDKLKLNVLCICCPGLVLDGKTFEKNNVLANDFATLDFDHLSYECYQNVVAAVKEHRKDWNVQFVQNGVRHIPPQHCSLHVIIGEQVKSLEMGDAWIQTQQQAFMDKLCEHVPEAREYFDSAVVHYGRKLFLTKWTDIVYISKDFFEVHSKIHPFRNTFFNKQHDTSITASATPAAKALQPKAASYMDVPLNEIAEAWMMNEHGKLDCPGSNHAVLLDCIHNLSCFTTDADELYFAVQNICTSHDDEDKQRICVDAKKYSMNFLPNTMKELVSSLKKSAPQDSTASDAEDEVSMKSNETRSFLVSDGLSLPKDIYLPSYIKTILGPIPQCHRKAAFATTFAMLTPYTSSLSVVGCSGLTQPVILNSALVGGPATGKSMVHNFLKAVLLNRQTKRDEQNMDAYNKWLEQKQLANSSKQLTTSAPPQKQQIFTTSSVLGFCKNMKESQKNSILCTDEISVLAKYSRNSYSSTTEFIRLGWDGAEHRSNSGSVGSFQGNVKVKLGSALCLQPSYLNFFSVDDGTVSREYFNLMGTASSFSIDVPQYREYTDAEKQTIESMLDLLEQYDAGPIHLPKCVNMLKEWQRGFAVEFKQQYDAGQNPSDALQILSHRCSDIALRIGAICYVLQGCKEDAVVQNIVKYVANDSMYNMYILYGHEFTKPNTVAAQIAQNQKSWKKENTTRIILNALPNDTDFGVDEMKQAMTTAGLTASDDTANVRLSNLKSQGYLAKKGKGKWRKTSAI